jgi:hypothetical protein
MTDGPLIVQSDKTLLLEVDHELADECRHSIAPFAELERAPEHIHTYRLTPLGLWNARAAGHDAEGVVDVLLRYSRYAVPHALLVDVADTMGRYGRLQLQMDPAHGLVLHAFDRAVLEEVLRAKKVQPLVGARICSSSAGRQRIWPAMSTVRPIRSFSRRTAGRFARTRRRPSTDSSTVARVWLFSPVALARRSSAQQPWQRWVRPR